MISQRSTAIVRFSPRNDIDLLVVLDDVDDARVEGVRLRRALRGVGVPLDVIVMSVDRFEETRDVVGAVARRTCEVWTRGVSQ